MVLQLDSKEVVCLSGKISVKDVEKAISRQPIEIDEINGKKIIFNPNVSLEDILITVRKISNALLDEDGNFFPEIKQLLIFGFMVKNATNIPVKTNKDGNPNSDFIYNLMSGQIGEKLMSEFIVHPIYSFLCDGIEEILEFKKEVYFRRISHHNKTFEGIDTLILDIKNAVQKISSFADEHKNLVSSGTLNKMIETLDKFKVK